MSWKTIVAGILACGACLASARAQEVKLPDGKIRIGIVTDMSGPYSDIGGQGAVESLRMAAADFMKDNPELPVEILFADHQNKPDVAAAKVREWIDVQHVNMLIDLGTSSVAFAVMNVVKLKDKIAIVTAPASSDITGTRCNANTVHYIYDSYALGNGAGRAMTQRGGDSWFFIAADYAFGDSLVRDTTKAITQLGGRVVGTTKAPLNTADFSSFLLQAQASKAKVIGLANAGGDFINAVKTAHEFGVTKSGAQRLAGMLVFLSDIHSLGLQTAQGLEFVTGFYWDFDADTRRWSHRYFDKMQRMPTQINAGDYSATLHYLKAVKAAGTTDTAAVMAKMREMPINDFFAKNGVIRADGRMVHDMLLVQVKTPAESKYPWDYYKVNAVIPGAQAFRPLAESECPLVRN